MDQVCVCACVCVCVCVRVCVCVVTQILNPRRFEAVDRVELDQSHCVLKPKEVHH